MKKFISRGFTLIELLIVIGILGILVIAVLLTLNPAEAQKKTRDAKRMKDMATLQSAVQQWFDGGGTIPAVLTSWKSDSLKGQACDGTGWLGLAGGVCNYLNPLPIPPTNGATRAFVNAANCTTASLIDNYRVTMDVDAAYEVNVRQESTQNCGNVINDGGDSFQWAEIGSKLTLITN